MAQIERVERSAGGGAAGASGAAPGRRRPRPHASREPADDRGRIDLSPADLPAADDGLEVPDFIPPG